MSCCRMGLPAVVLLQRPVPILSKHVVSCSFLPPVSSFNSYRWFVGSFVSLFYSPQVRCDDGRRWSITPWPQKDRCYCRSCCYRCRSSRHCLLCCCSSSLDNELLQQHAYLSWYMNGSPPSLPPATRSRPSEPLPPEPDSRRFQSQSRLEWLLVYPCERNRSRNIPRR